MKYSKIHGKLIAAAKAGVSPKTASQYLKNSQLTNEREKSRHWRTRDNPFETDWDEITSFLKNAPGLEAKTIMEWLIEKYPSKYNMGQLRTLQRHFQEWRALHGPEKEIMFPQKLEPGRQSQSDYTCMNKLNITISREPFPHLLFHFMLPYSRWETVSVCYSESFDSLAEGYEKAVWELGAVAPEHRTDNLNAATHAVGNSREFNNDWLNFLSHYKVTPSRNNPGEGHENGSIEKSHDIFKNTVDQQLMLRGSRDFPTLDDYKAFLVKVQEWRNHGRGDKLTEEYRSLKELPEVHWNAPRIVPIRVSPSSVIKVANSTYSVPSRLIGLKLCAHIYPAEVKLFYGDKCLLSMPKIPPGAVDINYRHIVGHLLRKPGAFAHYQYRDFLFPRLVFRQAYDALTQASPSKGHKHYLEVLQFTAITNEGGVSAALDLLFEAKELPMLKKVKELIEDSDSPVPVVKINRIDLNEYDRLIKGCGVKYEIMH